MTHPLFAAVGLVLAACSTPEPEPEPAPEPALEPEPESPPPPTYADQAEPPVRPTLDPARSGDIYLRLGEVRPAGVVRLGEGGVSAVAGGDVVDIHRAPDGSIWALGAALKRLDGEESVSLPEAIERPRHVALDTRGRAWIAADEEVGRWDGSTWVATPWAALAPDEKGYTQDLLVDRDGTVWLSTLERVYRFDGAWAAVPLPEEALSNMPGALRQDSTGAVLVASSGGVYRRDGEAWARLDEVDAREAFDQNGDYGVRAWRKTAFLLGPDGEKRLSVPDGASRLTGATVDAQGRVWIATDVGAYLLGEPGWWLPLSAEGVRSDIVQIVAAGSGPASLPEAPPPSMVLVQATIVQGGAPVANTPIELCPSPQMMYRGDSPCDGSAFRAVGKTDGDGVVRWEAPRAGLRLTWKEGDGWKSQLGGDFRCCDNAQADTGEVALPE